MDYMIIWYCSSVHGDAVLYIYMDYIYIYIYIYLSIYIYMHIYIYINKHNYIYRPIVTVAYLISQIIDGESIIIRTGFGSANNSLLLIFSHMPRLTWSGAWSDGWWDARWWHITNKIGYDTRLHIMKARIYDVTGNITRSVHIRLLCHLCIRLLCHLQLQHTTEVGGMHRFMVYYTPSANMVSSYKRVILLEIFLM